jgi:Lrp/AsnC family transcriptional regulator for asnA, asnC and gidA
MDEIDTKIVRALKKDSRTSFVSIGKQLGMTEGAVRQRVGKLRSSGVIRKFTIEAAVDVSAIILIGTSNRFPTSKVAEAIRKLGVDRIYEISGNYDIVCFAEGSTMQEVNSIVESIRGVEGVIDTTTMMVLK